MSRKLVNDELNMSVMYTPNWYVMFNQFKIYSVFFNDDMLLIFREEIMIILKFG
jgi:hypothetical protein